MRFHNSRVEHIKPQDHESHFLQASALVIFCGFVVALSLSVADVVQVTIGRIAVTFYIETQT
jgi:hypothetical protein